MANGKHSATTARTADPANTDFFRVLFHMLVTYC